MVAIVVFAMVLVPICSSLADNGGNGGNGDNGGDSIEVINDIQQIWGEEGVELAFKSYEYYSSAITPTLPHEFQISKQSMMGAVSSFPDGEFSCEIPLFVYFYEDGSYYQEMYLYYDCYGDECSIDIIIDDNGTDLDSYYDMIWTIHTDYSVTEQFKYSEDDEWSSYDWEFLIDSFIIMSDSLDGYAMHEYELINPVFSVGSRICVEFNSLTNADTGYIVTELTEDMFVDDVLRIPYTFTVTPDDGPVQEYDIVIECNIVEVDDGKWVMSDEIGNESWSEQRLSMSYSGTLNGSAISGTTSSEYAGISIGIPSANPSNGGSGNNGDSGIVGMMVGIIPVFVGLAILIYVVTMFMPERQKY